MKLLQETDWPVKGLLDIPGWSGLGMCGQLYEAALGAPAEGMNVEIGCYFGRSTVAICRALMDRGKGERLLSIDPFEVPDGEDDLGSQMALFPKPWDAENRKYVSAAGVENSDLLVARSLSTEAREAVKGPIRFVFVDGDHRYETVKAEIEWLLPLMAEGGIMAFDDIHCNVHKWGVERAVVELVIPRMRKQWFVDRPVQACQYFEMKGAA